MREILRWLAICRIGCLIDRRGWEWSLVLCDESTLSSRALCVDPLNPCSPIGALYAAFGVHGGLPLSHGASGCCRFQRMELAKHFQKTVHVPSTLLRDRAAMFGGEPEVVEAVENVFRLYDPEVLVINTTCLSETIGDDMCGIVERLQVPLGKAVVWASTPGYAGSQLAGYGATVAALIRQLGRMQNEDAASTDVASFNVCESEKSRLCLLPGWLNPSDVDAVMQYVNVLFNEVTVLPDVRGVFDSKTPDNPSQYAPGGTPLKAIEHIAQCSCGLALGREATKDSACALGEMIAKSSIRELPLPIGITATDHMIGALSEMADQPVPDWIAQERTRLIDGVMQVVDYLYGKRLLICCDADLATAITSFAVDVGLVPSCVAVGDALSDFEAHLRSTVEIPGECVVLTGKDRLAVEEYVISHPVDLVLGDTRNKRLANRMGVPLIRIGFPVVDRPLSHTQSLVGYSGALSLLRRIVEALCDASEHDMAPEELSISRYF
ncbi:MAG: nitrogenase component 1 [Raoultibacter sp.]